MNKQVSKAWTPGQIHVKRIFFSDEKDADKMTKWVNSNVSRGQASKEGSSVVVGSLPISIVRLGYSKIGATGSEEIK